MVPVRRDGQRSHSSTAVAPLRQRCNGKKLVFGILHRQMQVHAVLVHDVQEYGNRLFAVGFHGQKQIKRQIKTEERDTNLLSDDRITQIVFCNGIDMEGNIIRTLHGTHAVDKVTKQHHDLLTAVGFPVRDASDLLATDGN